MTSPTRTLEAPLIQTELPGPKTQKLIERDQRVISTSYTRGYPFAIAEGQGAVVIDPDGNRFLDFCAGIAVCTTGHAHPKVVEAITEQSKRFLHMSGTDFYYDGMVTLAERLVATFPGGDPARVFFCNSGAEAIEGALKLARYHTGRQGILSFYKGFHGRTFGAMSVSASKSIQRKRFSPLVPGVFHAHYPDHLTAPMGATPEETGAACLDWIRNVLFKTVARPEEMAAILVEPIQGEGGYVVPPDGFLTGLQALAREHGILVIADEVQSGIGRTGTMWASDHTPGFEPDIITSAKGLASGLPLGAILARADVMDWPPGVHATTFGGNPVACAAALATLDLLEGGLMENARQQGDTLMKKLRTLQQSCNAIAEVRGKGLMVGIAVTEPGQPKTQAPATRDAWVDQSFYKGLLILGCGESAIRFCPPLVVDAPMIDKAVDILAEVISRRKK